MNIILTVVYKDMQIFCFFSITEQLKRANINKKKNYKYIFIKYIFFVLKNAMQ